MRSRSIARRRKRNPSVPALDEALIESRKAPLQLANESTECGPVDIMDSTGVLLSMCDPEFELFVQECIPVCLRHALAEGMRLPPGWRAIVWRYLIVAEILAGPDPAITTAPYVTAVYVSDAGLLRLTWSEYSAAFEGLSDNVMSEALAACDVCGCPGTARSGRGCKLITRCNAHDKA
jgi:hypothetical protein